MTFNEYRQQIDIWTLTIHNAGLRLDSGDPVPITFWKTFLGITRKQHQDMYNGKFKNKSGHVPKYVQQSIKFASLMASEVFLEQAQNHLKQFEEDKVS